jgi:hypothetical protein
VIAEEARNGFRHARVHDRGSHLQFPGNRHECSSPPRTAFNPDAPRDGEIAARSSSALARHVPASNPGRLEPAPLWS